MSVCEITVAETKTGGRRLSVYGGCTCHFTFEPVQGAEKTVREVESFNEGCGNENQQNIVFAYRQATRKLQELGFRVEHPPHRQRFVR